jgi:N-acyl-D-amino-acid deacylase
MTSKGMSSRKRIHVVAVAILAGAIASCKRPSNAAGNDAANTPRSPTASAPDSSARYDVLLRRGRVVDGTGAPARVADVAIRDGKIVAVGDVAGEAPIAIDAAGLVVAPGFIDVHSHIENIVRLPSADNFVHMGVTTAITGNCGFSASDLAAFFAQIVKTKVAINVGSLIGHGAIREKAMGGDFDRAPSAAELDAMKALVEKAMNDGAFGFSTGLIYVPGTWAKDDEIIALAKVAAAHHGTYASHIRGEGRTLFDSVKELLRVGEAASIRVEYSHMKIAYKPSFGRAADVFALIEAARARGLDITQDAYLYPIASNALQDQLPASAFEGGHAEFLARLADPDTRAKIVATMKRNLAVNEYSDYAWMYVARYKEDKSLEGKNIPAIAKQLYGSDAVDKQIDAILEIAKDPNAQGNYEISSPDDLDAFVADARTMIGADTSVVQVGAEEPNPRQVGNNARMLQHYVRETNRFTLEEAIRKMTWLPASSFGIHGRGKIAEGYAADVVVFDPDAVGTTATLEDANHYATGFKHVFVNGVEVLRDDQELDARPGVPVRFTDAN